MLDEDRPMVLALLFLTIITTFILGKTISKKRGDDAEEFWMAVLLYPVLIVVGLLYFIFM